MTQTIVYSLHLGLVIASYLAPFLINWPLAVFAYGIVILQHAIFGKCLMNEHHGLQETEDRIFYTELVEKLGLHPDPKLLRFVVRKVLYPTLAAITLLWQVVLGHEPLLF